MTGAAPRVGRLRAAVRELGDAGRALGRASRGGDVAWPDRTAGVYLDLAAAALERGGALMDGEEPREDEQRFARAIALVIDQEPLGASGATAVRRFVENTPKG